MRQLLSTYDIIEMSIVSDNNNQNRISYGATLIGIFTQPLLLQKIPFIRVPILKEVNFGKVKLWDVEHFWTDFDLSKRRDLFYHALC